MPLSSGDRVRLRVPRRIDGEAHAAGSAGTVTGPAGKGRYTVRMDSGQAARIPENQLEALPTGSPAAGINDVVSLSAGWDLEPADHVRRTLRAATAPEPDDPPAFLAEQGLAIVHRVVARERATAGAVRRGLAEPPLALSVPTEPGATYVAVARHPSGALTIHLPDEAPATRGATAAAAAAAVESPAPPAVVFTIRVGDVPPEPGAADGAGRRALLGFIGKAVKVFVMKVVDAVVGVALPELARRLEQTLWDRAGRREGWVRIVDLAAGQAGLRRELPNVPPGGRGLLCIHGTFSNTVSAFGDWLTGAPLAALRQRYAEHVYGFEHFTFSKAPADNVRQMLDELTAKLPPGQDMTLDVVTHSRGGLVLRTLLAELARTNDADGRLRLGRVVLVASPNLGTPLATPRRWEETLGWFANLLDMFPDNPLTTAAGWVSGGLAWLARHVTGDLPGLASMDADGPVVRSLAGPALPAHADWYALVANWEPDDRLVLRLADMGVDGFFAGANDLVVPTEGGWRLGRAAGASVAADRVACFGAAGNLLPDQPSAVHHMSFFARPEAHAYIAAALAGAPLALSPVLDPAATLPTRVARRSAFERVGVRPATAGRAPAAAAVALSVPVAPGGGVVTATVATRPADAAAGHPARRADECLSLIVQQVKRSELDGGQPGDDDGDEPISVLLATYAGACVLIPFPLRNPRHAAAAAEAAAAKARAAGPAAKRRAAANPAADDGPGTRMARIIAGQKDIDAFAEGRLERELTVADIERIGATLFDTLFRDGVRRLYDQARFRDERRKLNVVFTSMIPWVADLPWEFAFDASCRTFLATSDVRFVRNVLTALPADAVEFRPGPLRVLVVSAQPRRVAALSIAEEEALIRGAFKPLIDAGAVEVTVLPEATPEQLHAHVRQNFEDRRFDVVHFIGHGRFDDATQTGYLLFEDGKGEAAELSTAQVRDILRSRGIKLVFLNACQSGRGGRADFNKGVAPGLVADGVPAVLANQYSVLDAAATTFAQHFYWCLAQGLSLGDAAREARIALNYAGGGLIGWGVPVLFTRDPEYVLCRARVRDDVMLASAGSEAPETAGGARAAAATAGDGDGRRTLAFPGVGAPSARMPGTRPPLIVAVWDVNRMLPTLAQTLGEMNAAQRAIEFRCANLTAPYGTWVASTAHGSVAYLQADRTGKRLEKLAASTGADYLVCVTNLPMADASHENIYLWLGEGRVVLFSTWGFDPPLCDEPLRAALANVVVAALANLLDDSDEAFADEREGSLFYFNRRREVRFVAGPLRLAEVDRKRLSGAIARRKLPEGVMEALEALMRMYHAGQAAPQAPAARRAGAGGGRAKAAAGNGKARRPGG